MSKPVLATVAARKGGPFEILDWGRNGTYMVRRTDPTGRSHSLILTRHEAIQLSNALIDVIEGEP